MIINKMIKYMALGVSISFVLAIVSFILSFTIGIFLNPEYHVFFLPSTNYTWISTLFIILIPHVIYKIIMKFNLLQLLLLSTLTAILFSLFSVSLFYLYAEYLIDIIKPRQSFELLVGYGYNYTNIYFISIGIITNFIAVRFTIGKVLSNVSDK